MNISEMTTLQMNRTLPGHTGNTRISSLAGAPLNRIPSATEETTKKSFDTLLQEAFSAMNQQQVNVTNLQQQVITDPESVDLHDVTIAMAKARSSLNLTKSVIDRLVQGWSEITTTR